MRLRPTESSSRRRGSGNWGWPRLIAVVPVLALVIAGCITGKPYNPAATQPVTVVDLATTQPETYWSRPAVATVQALEFQPLWDACAEAARRYGFAIDRQDYRDGLLATRGTISKQVLEPWRRDTGTFHEIVENSLATHRRTVHFEIAHEEDGTYRVAPKVLVERFTILERRTTSAIQYRSIFAGPVSLQSRTSVAADDPDEIIPIRYYTPIDRDAELEKKLAHSIKVLLEKRGQKAVISLAQK